MLNIISHQVNANLNHNEALLYQNGKKSNQTKTELTLTAGEYVKQLELSYTVGAEWHSHSAVSCKVKHTLPIQPSNHTPTYIQVK